MILNHDFNAQVFYSGIRFLKLLILNMQKTPRQVGMCIGFIVFLLFKKKLNLASNSLV